MKLSVAVAKSGAPASAFVVWRGFDESVPKAAALGYHGIELALASADDIEPTKLYRLLDKYDMDVSCISTGQVFAVKGLQFTSTDPEIRQKALETFIALISLAKDFGKMINVGRVRGCIEKNQTREDAESLFLDVMKRICDEAAKQDIVILIEPVNRYETNFINTLYEGAEIIRKVGYDNLKIMADTFHMNIEEVKIGKSIVDNGQFINYIHFADSNRLAPGQGHMNFNEIFSSLKTIGFNGWASIEILPKPDADTAARKAAEFILPLIKKYNKQLEKGEVHE